VGERAKEREVGGWGRGKGGCARERDHVRERMNESMHVCEREHARERASEENERLNRK